MRNARPLQLVAPLCAALAAPAASQETPATEWDQGYEVAGPLAVLPYRERAEAENRMLRDRLENLLPGLMRECGLDMWLVINREYNEDPVYLTLVPAPVFAARRTTILVFHDRGPAEGVERLTVSRYALGDFYESAWEEGGSDDEQWTRLAEVVAERDPERIGVNTSEHWAFGDGLSASLAARLGQALGDDASTRLTSGGGPVHPLARDPHGPGDGGLPTARAAGPQRHRGGVLERGRHAPE